MENHKNLLLVYLVCISLILTFKMDKIGVLALTLFFLSVKVNKYYALIGSFVFYIFYYRYSEGFTSTPMPVNNNENNELVEPDEIYNILLNLIEDYDTKSFN